MGGDRACFAGLSIGGGANGFPGEVVCQIETGGKRQRAHPVRLGEAKACGRSFRTPIAQILESDGDCRGI